MMTSLRIGLTGGIGSGKSTVASMLVDRGAALVDTDQIARALTTAGGAALEPLAREFGASVIGDDGALDRERMRGLAFTDPNARRRLEAILHPMIGERALAQAAAAGGRPVAFDVPLLTESSAWRQRVGRVLVVDCREDTQVERVMRRSRWTREMVQRVISQQASRAARRRVADAVIFNDGLDLDTLRSEVDHLWGAWIGP